MITSNLLIDTIGPVIDGMFFNRLDGQVDYIIKDPVNPDGSTPADLHQHPARLFQLPLDQGPRQRGVPRQVGRDRRDGHPDPTIPYAYDVAVTFNGGAIVKGGFYLFTIRDSSNGDGSVQDLAETISTASSTARSPRATA